MRSLVVVVVIAILPLWSSCVTEEGESGPPSDTSGRLTPDGLIRPEEVARAQEAVDVVAALVESVVYSDCPNPVRDVCTTATLAVADSLRGTKGSVSLQVPGGIRDGIQVHPTSMPWVREGERAVVFLRLGEDVYWVESGVDGYLVEQESGIRDTGLTAQEYLAALREALR